jgi:hypothetical protein
MSIIEMKQERFRQLDKLSHTDLLWLIMRNEYGSGWTMDIDTNPEEEE